MCVCFVLNDLSSKYYSLIWFWNLNFIILHHNEFYLEEYWVIKYYSKYLWENITFVLDGGANFQFVLLQNKFKLRPVENWFTLLPSSLILFYCVLNKKEWDSFFIFCKILFLSLSPRCIIILHFYFTYLNYLLNNSF